MVASLAIGLFSLAFFGLPGLLLLRSARRELARFAVQSWWDLRGNAFLSPEDKTFRKFGTAYFAITVAGLLCAYCFVYGIVQLRQGHFLAPA